MSNLEDFWDNMELTVGVSGCSDFGVRKLIKSLRQEQGMVFWERGGKQFVVENIKLSKEFNRNISFELIIKRAKSEYDLKINYGGEANYLLIVQDFLDCLACLGKDKVKELIKECERINE
jgi:hypothetical protein